MRDQNIPLLKFMNFHRKFLAASLVAFATVIPVAAQDATTGPDTVTVEEFESLKGQVESLNESFLTTKTTVDKLAKIKVSGYIQAQWQQADSLGAPSVAGGNFPANSDQRFQLRRGRVKTAYETATSRYVLQIDVVPGGLVNNAVSTSGGVTIKDAYAVLMEPWLKTFSATFGVFDRPFGHEISYSSSMRESPERSRVFQTVFPGERDLGAKIEANPTEHLGFLQYFTLKAGLFTGMGPNVNENDRERDFIGRVGFTAPFYDLNLSIDGGVSAYLGKSTSVNDTALAFGDTSFITTATGNKLKTFERTVYGADVQTFYTVPVIGDILGGTSLRGEYLQGKMPGTKNSSAPYAASTSALVEREFRGWYVILVQNFGDKVQGVVKYDVYDPNTQVSGADLGKPGTNLGAADVQFSTLGLGAIYHWDENVKLTAYYDRVTNEESNAAATGSLLPYQQDLKDNVFTARVQVKF
jgi:hypothetical protein